MKGGLVRRSLKLLAPVMAAVSMTGYLVVLSAFSSPPAGAVSQVGGDDVPVLQPNWTWTYNQTYTLNDPGTGYFSVAETVTYKVVGVVQHTEWVCPAAYDGGLCTASTTGAVNAGTYSTYEETFSGSVTSGTGTADNETLTNVAGSVSGTQYQETSNMAIVELDQTQNISGKVLSIDTVNIAFTNDDVYTPAQVNEDFRLHSGDTWLENTAIYDNGIVNYSVSGIDGQSGSDPIDSTGDVNATATDASATVTEPIASNIPVDQITYGDTVNDVADARDWSNTYHNIVADSYETGLAPGGSCTSAQTAECEASTMVLTAATIPAPTSSVSETITPNVASPCNAVAVTGNLSSSASGSAVAVTLDESTITPDQVVTDNVTSTAGGAYTASFTVPVTHDGLNKPGAQAAFGILVTSGSASNAATLEVQPQDCTTLTNAPASGPQGGTASVSTTVTDAQTGQPISGASVLFSLSGQTATATGVSGANGVATATLSLVAGPPRTATLTSSFAGNTANSATSSTSSLVVTVDQSATSLQASEPTATIGDPVTFTAQVSRNGPSIATAPTGNVQFLIDGVDLGTPVTISVSGSATSEVSTSMPIGDHVITAIYSGDGNYAGSTGVIPTYDVHKPLTPTSTSLGVVPGSSVYGQPIALTAGVSSVAGIPTGSVEFLLGGTTDLGTAMLPGTGSNQVSINVTSLPVGNDSITAEYLGDGDVNYNTSVSAPFSETVTQDPTAVTITPPATTPVVGQSETYQIKVSSTSPGSGVPTGTVTVTIDGTPVATNLALTGGLASVTVPTENAGGHTVAASYSGDSNFKASTNSINETVNQAQTTTVVESSANPSIVGNAVTFTATVTANAPGGGDPTGLVNFFDNGTPIGSGGLTVTGTQDQASVELTSLSEGSGQEITAVYGGDLNYVGSTSSLADSVDQNVVPAPPVFDTSVSVTPTFNPSAFGQAVTWTATVTSAAGGGTPAGTVQFSVDGTNLGSPVTLNASGQATSISDSSLIAGGHTVIASYGGETTNPTADYSGSGQVYSQSVIQAATRMSLVASPSPVTYGQPETFTASLTAITPGAGIPGGVVQFLFNGTDFGNPVLTIDGMASITDSTALNPGTYTISAIATGDANFAGTSGGSSFVVSPVGVTQSVVAMPNPVIYGNSVIFEDTVAPAYGPGTPPTGTVEFFANGVEFGSTSLVSSAVGQRAGYAYGGLNAGTYSITAVYEGNTFYGSNTSAPITLVVQQAPTSMTATKAALSGTTLSATLIDSNNGKPIAGASIEFVAGSTVLCAAAVTNASGVATCSDSAHISAVLAAGGYTAFYFGSNNYLAYATKEGLV
jgi:Big-like domain-containing protein